MADTICAIATPLGQGGVSIIRLSGERALEIAKQVFAPFSKKQPEPRKAIFGKLIIDDIQDDALGLYFPAPKSFTGEEVVELQIHGGYYLSQTVLRALIQKGARLAERGEFSKRAVLNGQMDMSQAEGIIDLINASSMASLRAGSRLMYGNLKHFVEQLQDELTNCICEVNVALDYPEHDIEYITAQKIAETSTEIVKKIDKQLATAKTGLKVKNGVKVVLAGDPNVGKSSLLNALVGYERAIVTDIAGTTRDTLNESYEFNGLLFNVTDTAGLRETNDTVESVGIKRAVGEIETADLVVFVQDKPNKSIPEINNKNVIKILNKADKQQTVNEKDYDLIVSAKTGKNIEELKQLIFDKTIDQNIADSDILLTNNRHIVCLEKAKNALIDTISHCENTTLDCLSITLMQAWDALGEITGTTASEHIINEIFSKFCLGK